MDEKRIMHEKWNDIRVNEIQKQKMLDNIMNQKSSTRRNSKKAVLVLATIIPILIVVCIFQLLSTFSKSDSNKANAQKSAIENDSNENNIQKSETENETDIKYEDGYFYLQNPIQLQRNEGTSIECIYWCENELNILLKQDSFTATEGEISVEVKGEDNAQTLNFRSEKCRTLSLSTKNPARANLSLIIDGEEYSIKLSNENESEKPLNCRKVTIKYATAYIWDMSGGINGIYVCGEILDEYKKYYDDCDFKVNITDKNNKLLVTDNDYKEGTNGEILFINKDTRIDKIEICTLSVYRNNYYRDANNGLTEDEVFYIDIPKDGETIDVNKEFTKCDLNFKVGKVTRKYNNLIFTFDYDYNQGTISIDIVDDRYLVDGSMCRMNIENQQALFNSSVGIISDKIKFSIGAISLNLSEILEYE